MAELQSPSRKAKGFLSARLYVVARRALKCEIMLSLWSPLSVTSNEFRTLALSFAGATSVAVLGGIEFWINGAPFATLGSPDPNMAIIKLSREDQAVLVASAPLVFSPAPGGAGRRGMTQVRLVNAEGSEVERALKTAYRRAAPRHRPF